MKAVSRSASMVVVGLWLVACDREAKVEPNEAEGAQAKADADAAAKAEAEAIARENAATPKPPAKAEPPASKNDVDLTFEGAFAATLKGKGGSCGPHRINPNVGAGFRVRSEELGVQPAFDFTILATSEEEWESPAIILNVPGSPPRHYGRDLRKPSPTDRITLARDYTSAEVDVELRDLMSKDTVRVKGSIRCPK